MECIIGAMITGRGRQQTTRRQIWPSAIFSTTIPTWTVLGLKPGLHVEKPATDPPAQLSSYGTAYSTNSAGQKPRHVNNYSPKTNLFYIVPSSVQLLCSSDLIILRHISAFIGHIQVFHLLKLLLVSTIRHPLSTLLKFRLKFLCHNF
jgi:hypothetical protein